MHGGHISGMKVLERLLPEQIILRNPDRQGLLFGNLVPVSKAYLSVQNHQSELLRILLVRTLSLDPVAKSGDAPVLQREDDAVSATKILQDLR